MVICVYARLPVTICILLVVFQAAVPRRREDFAPPVYGQQVSCRCIDTCSKTSLIDHLSNRQYVALLINYVILWHSMATITR